MNNELIMFSLNGCGFCENIKKRLHNESIPFTEYEINDHSDLWNQVVLQTQSEYVPVFFIKEKNTMTGQVLCPKKDFDDEDTIIGLLRIYLP
jgi:glutaredoxin